MGLGRVAGRWLALRLVSGIYLLQEAGREAHFSSTISSSGRPCSKRGSFSFSTVAAPLVVVSLLVLLLICCCSWLRRSSGDCCTSFLLK